MEEDDEVDAEYDEEMEDFPEEEEEIDQALLERVLALKKEGAWWADEILDIENEPLRERAFESSEKFVEKVKAAENEFEAKGKDFKYFWAENPHLITERVRISSRISRESVGITGDDLGDVAEDMRFLAGRDLETLEAKGRARTLLGQVDPEVGKELAEKVIEEEEVSEEAAESLRRLARLREFGQK